MYSSKKPRVFYGYWVLVAAFFCNFILSGTAWYCFSLFVKPLEADFGWGRGETMAAFSILWLIIGIASPFTGRVVDRYGARVVISAGAFVSGIGFALLSLINSLWFFYLGYVVVGIGMAAMGPVPASAVVSNWFEKRRGTAIGIMSTGMGLGGFALAPLVGGYLIPNFGWRISFLALALLIWVLIIPLALLVIRTRPADMGLYPDGIEAPAAVTAAESSSAAVGGLTLRMALVIPALWLIGISHLISAIGRNGIIHNQVPYLADIGFPVATAATALGTVGLSCIIGQFGFGWLCDRIPVKYAWCISLGFQLVGIIIFMGVGPASPPAIIWLYAIFIGVGMGGWLPAMSMLVSTNFGLASYGAIFGVVTLFLNIGMATGPLVAGYMYDIMNSYHWFFIVSIILVVLAIPAILAVRRPASI